MAADAAGRRDDTDDPMPSDVPHLQLRELLSTLVPRHLERWGHSDDWPALLDFQRAVAAHGWSAPAWPVAIGGKGLDVAEQVACEAEFRRVGAPRRISVFGVNNVGPTINAVGTPEQQRHVQAILTADEIWCQGFSEPDAGSDLAGLHCRADLVDDHFLVNGAKIWTSVGLNATHCMLLTRTDPEADAHRGITALLVPLDLPGITRRPIKQLNGRSEFAELHFDDVQVPRSAVLGPLHDGWRVTMTTLGFERAGVISVAGDLASDVERLVLGGTVGDRPLLRQLGARLYSQARILQWTGQRVVDCEAGPSAPPAASSLIKLAWSMLAKQLGQFEADIAGMAGATGLEEHAADRLLSSLASSIAGGTTEIVKNIIGERGLGLPREPRGGRS